MKRRSHAFRAFGTRRGHARFVAIAAAIATASPAGAASAAATATKAGDQGPAGAPLQDSRVLAFAIPAGPLDSALKEFERLTGLTVVLVNPGIGTVQSPGASGSFTPSGAMDALLSGTNVQATFSSNTVRLDIRGASELVAVTGETMLSSPKYTAPLLDTPQTVVVIPQAVFEEQNATSLREVLRNTPGITMSIGEGASGTVSAGDNLFIRGFNARNDIYIDGVRDPGEVSRDLFNVESVEVSKGPTSVTGGRGATGGSVNLVSKTARFSDATNVRLTAGSADHFRSSVDVNRKVTDSIAFRVNAVWQDAGYPGRDVQKNTNWGVAPSLAFSLGKSTQLTLNYSRLQQDNVPDWGIPTLLPDVAIAQGVTVNDLDFRNFYGLASRDYEKTTSDAATAIVQHKFTPTLSLRNLTRVGKNYRDAVLTPPRPVTTVAGQGSTDPGYDPLVAQIRRTDTKYQHRDDKLASNQTDLTSSFSTGAIGHSTDVGLEFTRDRQPTYAFTDLFTNGRPPVTDLFNPRPNDTYLPAYAKTGATSDAHAQSAAMYAFDTIRLNNKWQADVGLRWDYVDIDYETVAVTGVASNFGRTDKNLSGRGGIVYKPVEHASVYAAFSTSFAPSFDGSHGLTVSAAGVNNQALPPETTRNFEVGTKWDVRPTLQLTAAAFDIEKTNAKTTDLNGATVLAGNQRVKGVEFGLIGELTPVWRAFAGLALMDGTVEDSGIPSEVGQQLPYVPDVSFNVWSTYRLPKDIMVGGGMSYSSGNYFNQTGGYLLVAGGTVPQPKYVDNAAAIQALTKYWVFNAVATYEVTRHIELQLNLSNLFNTQYADRAYDRHFLPGPARQILFSPVISW